MFTTIRREILVAETNNLEQNEIYECVANHIQLLKTHAFEGKTILQEVNHIYCDMYIRYI